MMPKVATPAKPLTKSLTEQPKKTSTSGIQTKAKAAAAPQPSASKVGSASKATAKSETQSKASPSAPDAASKSSSTLPAARPPKKSGASKPIIREVIYEKITASLFVGEKALTVDQAKKLLGWQQETENVQFGSDFLGRDIHGKKFRCTNNVKNRPLYMTTIVVPLVQEILCRKWQMNCESVIIGKTGIVLDAQHRLISLVLAGQHFEKSPGKWHEYWQTEPTIEVLIAFGAEESDKVVNTLNTGKPRTLTDVLFRSEHFANIKPNERKRIARITADAVKMLWHRTGADQDAFRPKRTHAESTDFIERHPRLLDCVRHVFEEDGAESCVGKYMTPLGYAAALCYLMGASATDPAKKDGYCGATDPDETMLDMSLWDTAQEFWVLLASGSKELAAINDAFKDLYKQGAPSVQEKCAVLVKGWAAYADREKVTAADVKLTYAVNDEGMRELAESPKVGGIDVAK